MPDEPVEVRRPFHRFVDHGPGRFEGELDFAEALENLINNSPLYRSKSMPNPDLSLLEKELRAGTYNNDTLRHAIEVVGSSTVYQTIRNIRPGLRVDNCNDCRLICFATTLSPVYGGLRWSCPGCVGNYIFCSKCNGLILCGDDKLHFHTNEIAQRAMENVVAPFDADIAGRGAEFRSTVDRKTNKKSRVIKPAPIRYFGIELEVERHPDRIVPPDLILKAKHALADGLVLVKHDGSLRANAGGQRGANGFEIVTLPCTMDYHRTAAGWQKFFQVMSPWLEEKPPTTGLHVHVSYDSMTRATVGKIIKFVNSEPNLEFMKMIANRDFTQPNPNGRVYAAVWHDADRKVTELVSRRTHAKGCKNSPVERILRGYYVDAGNISWDGYGHPILKRTTAGPNTTSTCKCPPGRFDYGGHYAAFNVRTNRPTIEFRMGQGSTNETHFWAYLDFSDAIIGFCEATSFQSLTWQNFIDWFKVNRYLYRGLDRWLVVGGYIEPLKKKD